MDTKDGTGKYRGRPFTYIVQPTSTKVKGKGVQKPENSSKHARLGSTKPCSWESNLRSLGHGVDHGKEKITAMLLTFEGRANLPASPNSSTWKREEARKKYCSYRGDEEGQI